MAVPFYISITIMGSISHSFIFLFINFLFFTIWYYPSFNFNHPSEYEITFFVVTPGLVPQYHMVPLSTELRITSNQCQVWPQNQIKNMLSLLS